MRKILLFCLVLAAIRHSADLVINEISASQTERLTALGR